jgi:hypothetical protein
VPERQSRITQSTSWPTSGCKPSIASTTRADLVHGASLPN